MGICTENVTRAPDPRRPRSPGLRVFVVARGAGPPTAPRYLNPDRQHGVTLPAVVAIGSRREDTGTADDVAAARDSRTDPRSEHKRSKVSCENSNRAPEDRSVPVTTATGVSRGIRSLNVARSKRISS